MRVVNRCLVQYVVLAGFFCAGCAHTRDVSSASEYKPWIGKTVRAVGSRGYNIFSPTWGPYFLDTSASYNNYPVVGKVPEGHPVVITAVKRTQGRYLIGTSPFTHDQLVLSMEHPSKKNRRIFVRAEINYVEPFRGMEGHKVESPSK